MYTLSLAARVLRGTMSRGRGQKVNVTKPNKLRREMRRSLDDVCTICNFGRHVAHEMSCVENFIVQCQVNISYIHSKWTNGAKRQSCSLQASSLTITAVNKAQKQCIQLIYVDNVIIDNVIKGLRLLGQSTARSTLHIAFNVSHSEVSCQQCVCYVLI